jgi:hypothetical protein
MHLMLSARPLTGVTVISVPAKNYGQRAWGGTEIAIHWRKGFQDGGLRTTELHIHSSTHIRQIDEYLFHGYIPEVGMYSMYPLLSTRDPTRALLGQRQ